MRQKALLPHLTIRTITGEPYTSDDHQQETNPEDSSCGSELPRRVRQELQTIVGDVTSRRQAALRAMIRRLIAVVRCCVVRITTRTRKA